MTPVVDGLFELADGKPRLVGTRCRACGALYLPRAISGANPACREKRVETCLLPGTGTLHSYTVQRYQPPPLFRMDNWEPYALGAVDLSPGLRVMGMLTGIAFDEVRIGMALKVIAETLFSDDLRGDVATFKFTPLHPEDQP
ncbi:MAG TPA: OB-fold domain-containing protein [Novosphingobium sp.]|nr:OB-fold domain-containing protein [Novosphingobium sp.]